jgi:crossover junction endodeoxyribonuclease RuvC
LAACGYGVVEAQGAKAETLGFGCWQTAAGVRIELRLRTLFVSLTELLIRCRPDVVALEESFVGLNARTALSVGQVLGALLVACANAGHSCVVTHPHRWSKPSPGHGRADKRQAQQMAKARLGLERTPTPTHAADALAVAYCHATAPWGADRLDRAGSVDTAWWAYASWVYKLGHRLESCDLRRDRMCAPPGIFDPTGTCAIGAVVDTRGAVFGVDGLLVASAWIVPTIPRANTNLSTIVIAERIADWLHAWADHSAHASGPHRRSDREGWTRVDNGSAWRRTAWFVSVLARDGNQRVPAARFLFAGSGARRG